MPTAPDAPLSLTATLDGSQAQLLWTAPAFDGNSAITGYRIERSVNGGPFEVLAANTASTNTAYNDTGIQPGMAYAYRIYALNAQGQSIASNEASVQTAAAGSSGAVASSDALADAGSNYQGFILLSFALLLISAPVAARVRWH